MIIATPFDRPTTAPLLASARLTLRSAGIADFEDSSALWGDPATVRHTGGRPLTSEEVWTRLLRYAGLWALLGYGYWIIEETGSGRFVGEIGFADYKRAVVPGLVDAPECGWALAPWAQGRGYAREALGSVLAWADRTLDAPRTVCLIDPANAASLRLAAGGGYIAYAHGQYRGTDVTLLERPRGVSPAG